MFFIFNIVPVKKKQTNKTRETKKILKILEKEKCSKHCLNDEMVQFKREAENC